MFTVKEYAERMKVNQTKVLGWINSGELKATNVSNGSDRPLWRIDPENAKAFEEARQPKVAEKTKRRKKASVPDYIG